MASTKAVRRRDRVDVTLRASAAFGVGWLGSLAIAPDVFLLAPLVAPRSVVRYFWCENMVYDGFMVVGDVVVIAALLTTGYAICSGRGGNVAVVSILFYWLYTLALLGLGA